MFCPQCGNENPERSYFCLNCGTPLEGDGTDTMARLKSSHPQMLISTIYGEGVERFTRNDLPGAMTKFDEVVFLDPGHASAWNAKSVIYYRLNDRQQALECIEKALLISPDNTKFQNNRDILLRKTGNLPPDNPLPDTGKQESGKYGLPEGHGYQDTGRVPEKNTGRWEETIRAVHTGKRKKKIFPARCTAYAVFVTATLIITLWFLQGILPPPVPGPAPPGVPPESHGGTSTVTMVDTTPVQTATHSSPTHITTAGTTVSPASVTEGTRIRQEFKYTLRGMDGSVLLPLDNKSYNLLQSLDPYVYAGEANGFGKFLQQPEQDRALEPLIQAIRIKTEDKDDQARIAISLVQNIPYDYDLLASKSPKVRYPYQVMYDNRGICSEKSLLAAYLLEKLGFGVAIFRFDKESHMAVGVRAPAEYSFRDTGFAFIETTTPTILTDDQEDYIGAGRLVSSPEIVVVSEGLSLDSIGEEYHDRNEWIGIMQKSKENNNHLDSVTYSTWKKLVAKYGIQIGKSRDQNTPLIDIATRPGTNTTPGTDKPDDLVSGIPDRMFLEGIFGRENRGYISAINHDYSWALETLRNRNYNQAKIFLDKLEEDCDEALKVGSLDVSPGLAAPRDTFISAVKSIKKGSSDLYKAVNAYSYGSDSEDYTSQANGELSEGFSQLNDFLVIMDEKGYIHLT